VVVDQWDGEYIRRRLDDGIPRYGRWMSEVEDLGRGISHVGNRLGGNVEGYEGYRLPDDKS